MEVNFAVLNGNELLVYLQVEYNKCIVVAGLSFFKHLAKLKDRPLKSLPPKPPQPLPELKPEPGQPVTLGERVFHAFAQQNMPVHKPLSLPVTSVLLSCPGNVVLNGINIFTEPKLSKPYLVMVMILSCAVILNLKAADMCISAQCWDVTSVFQLNMKSPFNIIFTFPLLFFILLICLHQTS